MTGSAGRVRRIDLSTSWPLPSGSITSRMTRSTPSATARDSPSCAVAAQSTAWPSAWRPRWRKSAMAASSSTTRIRTRRGYKKPDSALQGRRHESGTASGAQESPANRRHNVPRFRTSAIALALGLTAAAPAGAAVPHTVQPGETLWSIAAANGFTTRSFAAYNGLGEGSNVRLGSTIMVPAVPEAATALASQGTTTTSSTTPTATSGTATSPSTTTSTPTTTATSTTPSSTAAPRPMGGYTIRPGDTLSGLAARAGVPVQQMAWMNGLPPDARIIAGTSLKLPPGAPIQSTQPAPVEPRPVAPAAPPQPTGTRMNATQVGSIAAQHGVSPSLAAAVAYQESGFNNAAVSPASARGVMQIMPGTWEWVQRNLASTPLNPSSASDNVRAGSLYLNQLIRQTGGDVPTAVAGYYQGLGSVRSRGLYDDTKRYVQNVLSLRSRFGG